MTDVAREVIASATSLWAAALATGRTLHARDASGAVRTVAVAEWLAPASPVDERLLDCAEGPVLDVGCGPGRHVRELSARGVLVLGIDASPAAVRVARSRGAAVHHGSVFGAVPGEGQWRTALLLDGNLGIGGDPVALLRRLGELLDEEGRVLCETEPPGMGMRVGPVRLEGGSLVTRWFSWARVGSEALEAVAGEAGLQVTSRWEDGGRWFAELRRPTS